MIRLPNILTSFVIAFFSYPYLVSIKRDALRDLVPFVQFKKREKHPRESINFI